MRNQLIGGPDMAQRIVHAEELLASYEKEKEKIDWQKPSCWGVTAGCTSIYQIWYNRLLLFSPVTRDRYQTRDGQSASARAMREGAFPGDDAGEISLHCPGCGGPALCSARWCDSLEESDDGFCEDVIAITGNHVGSICHVHIFGVRTLFEETLGPCLT